ncbi:phosphoribosyltransferase family protein [Streptomyces sp. TRM68367]|uniref:phosphoribosyltransferase n=1 Tax=Streptomyces sp. TRM68367 TaxID=2758415 RepID=UPI00165C67AC|nr:phosphoribosyltransferase family protein [Streptomyces sp. TRM68367]MBC9727645.1 phosphoribosyltransferase [Streptomyces sp. TRM68367]
MSFRDRAHAGRELALRLVEWADSGDLVNLLVLGLPRGGVPVAAQVARALHAPLDVLVTGKVSTPVRPGAAIGAIVAEEPPLFDRRALEMLRLTPDRLGSDVARERTELHRREHLYRGGRPATSVRGRTVVLVDDGLATGLTMTAALRFLRRLRPGRLVVAVPVGGPRAVDQVRQEADELVCLEQPASLHAIGEWYEDFAEVSDTQVVEALRAVEATA